MCGCECVRGVCGCECVGVGAGACNYMYVCQMRLRDNDSGTYNERDQNT